jgi:hypothetical protein
VQLIAHRLEGRDNVVRRSRRGCGDWGRAVLRNVGLQNGFQVSSPLCLDIKMYRHSLAPPSHRQRQIWKHARRYGSMLVDPVRRFIDKCSSSLASTAHHSDPSAIGSKSHSKASSSGPTCLAAALAARFHHSVLDLLLPLPSDTLRPQLNVAQVIARSVSWLLRSLAVAHPATMPAAVVWVVNSVRAVHTTIASAIGRAEPDSRRLPVKRATNRKTTECEMIDGKDDSEQGDVDRSASFRGSRSYPIGLSDTECR